MCTYFMRVNFSTNHKSTTHIIIPWGDQSSGRIYSTCILFIQSGVAVRVCIIESVYIYNDWLGKWENVCNECGYPLFYYRILHWWWCWCWDSDLQWHQFGKIINHANLAWGYNIIDLGLDSDFCLLLNFKPWLFFLWAVDCVSFTLIKGTMELILS